MGFVKVEGKNTLRMTSGYRKEQRVSAKFSLSRGCSKSIDFNQATGKIMPSNRPGMHLNALVRILVCNERGGPCHIRQVVTLETRKGTKEDWGGLADLHTKDLRGSE